MEYKYKIIPGTYEENCVHFGNTGEYIVFSIEPVYLDTFPLYQCIKCATPWILLLGDGGVLEARAATRHEVRQYWTPSFQHRAMEWYFSHDRPDPDKMDYIKFKK